ncbi:hypothetical protein F2Q69_00002181 [Brassica cretica]|uniref:Uncharacterized protein n=1 Tax=Brassica cretica TaxID=69181 RepID=A0A8S9NZV2_BRACR|nr:hypothetical protein F2Q69_00002181 [Brassica cretica]
MRVLLVTNAKVNHIALLYWFARWKKSRADKVLHSLLQSGDSARKYLPSNNEKKVEENNYILLDNFGLNCVSQWMEGSVSINPFLSRSSWCLHVYKYVVLGSRAP